MIQIFKVNGQKTLVLENLATITSSKRIYKADYMQSGIPFYRTKEIKELANGKDVSTELFISEKKYKEIKKKFGAPKVGDVMITAIGTIGEIYVVKEGDEFYFKDGNVLWLKNIKHINPVFLRYSLLSFVEGLNKMAHGAAYSALPIQRLKKHIIPVPSEKQQFNIITKLDKLLNACERLKDTYNLKVNQLGKLKTTVLSNLLRGDTV